MGEGWCIDSDHTEMEEMAWEVSEYLLGTLGRDFGHRSWLIRGQRDFSKQNVCAACSLCLCSCHYWV